MSTATADGLPALELRDVDKSFGGVHALRGVSLRIEPGEVHGLLGENGSGKSTLIKVLAGYHAPEAGELQVGDRQVPLPLRIGGAHALGIEFVHQDLGLLPSLTVVENLRIGDLAAEMPRWHISWRQERRRAAELFRRYGLDLDPAAPLSEVDPIGRAMLAIVRAVEMLRRSLERDGSTHKGLLVLDEPTVFLPRAGVEQVFALVREIVAGGAGVLFVSHDLDEVMGVTDRLTVLRDGAVVGTVETASTDHERVIDMIVGRRLEASAVRGKAAQRSTRLVLRGVSGVRVRDADLDLGEGEVVGLTGLAGSGFEELPYLVFGALERRTGTMTLDGVERDLARLSPAGAIDAGIALVPADRQTNAVVPSLPIVDNMMLPTLDDYVRAGALRHRRLREGAAELMETFDVRPRDPRPTCGTLSGGNQQKAVLAKWLSTNPRIFLLHEPTQGVDIGARQQIFALMRQAAADGMSVLCASSDYEQLALTCDRVVVLRRGRIAAELHAPVTKDQIIDECYRGGQDD